MRKVGLVAITALVLAGVGAWASTAHTPAADTLAGVRIDPSQVVANVKALPVDDFVDYTFVFTN